jgi:hypothetical protein
LRAIAVIFCAMLLSALCLGGGDATAPGRTRPNELIREAGDSAAPIDWWHME